MDKKITTNVPAHLFVGDDLIVHQTVTLELQKVFCKQQLVSAGCFCRECQKVKNEQHASIVPIVPENQYLLSDLSPIFERIRFRLESNEAVFFILKKAHTMTPVCANKLLKILEEPPVGYTFFLLTNNEQSLLPTIRSRCSIHHLQGSNVKIFLHPILSFFVDQEKQNDPFLFDQELKKHTPSELETIDLLHDLINSIKKKINSDHKMCASSFEIEKLQKDNHHKKLCSALEILQGQLKKPPQAGGALLFWRKLFLEVGAL